MVADEWEMSGMGSDLTDMGQHRSESVKWGQKWIRLAHVWLELIKMGRKLAKERWNWINLGEIGLEIG